MCLFPPRSNQVNSLQQPPKGPNLWRSKLMPNSDQDGCWRHLWDSCRCHLCRWTGSTACPGNISAQIGQLNDSPYNLSASFWNSPILLNLPTQLEWTVTLTAILRHWPGTGNEYSVWHEEVVQVERESRTPGLANFQSRFTRTPDYSYLG